MATLALQAGHGHALAMEDGPSLLLLAGVLHLVAAGAWLGGLLPLLLVVQSAPARIGAAAARWFSPMGKWCIALLVGSAIVQFWQLIGGLPGVLGTVYGWMALVKLALLIVLLAFAAANRYWLAPRLLQADPARAVLVRSIAVQTGFGLAVVLSAATLGSLPPSLHEQPNWPFALRPSLVALDDPDLRAEVMQGAITLLAGAALVLAGLAFHRRRAVLAVGVLAGGALCVVAAPHLDLLFVEAYPTSYYHSPTDFAATSIMHGAALFPQNCASCHGARGRGDGPAAAGLPEPPADLTAGHLWAHEDGELFWWLTHGIEAPEGGMAMPGFAGQLSPDDRWALIDYIRANNAGVSFHDTNAWPVPVQSPDFTMVCPGGRDLQAADLRGSVLHIVAMPGADAPVPPKPEQASAPVVTILMTDGGPAPHATDCVSTDPAVWAAYATLSGMTTEGLAGTQFLVDPNGWMRAAQRPGEGTLRWANPALLLADVQAICGHPIAAAEGGHAHH